MYCVLRFLLFLLPPEIAHRVALEILRFLYRTKLLSLLIRHENNNTPINTLGLSFKNPVGIAAGLDKNGDYIDCLAALGVGFIEIGSVTPKPQLGNPRPRLFRIPKKQTLLNRMGFNNKGVDYLVARLKTKKQTNCIIGVNIGKNKTTKLEKAYLDYLICLDKVFCYADFITINISSPNTPGLTELQTEKYLNNLLQPLIDKRNQLKQQHNKNMPLLVKLSPDLEKDQLQKVVGFLQTVAIDGMILTNTTQQKDTIENLAYAEEQGGVSGGALTELSNQCLQWAQEVNLSDKPIIAVGGIMSAEEAKKRLNRGAKLIQVYTGLIYQGPELIKRLIKGCSQ